jgi:hypothetical protein
MSLISLDQYKNYHGMLCFPSTGKACSDSFSSPFFSSKRQRRIIFVPHDPLFPLGMYSYHGVSALAYYSLVFFSFTGISTLLGQTKFLAAADLESASSVALPSPPTHVLDGLLQGKNLSIIRYFKYYFAIPAISVEMWHVQNKDTGELNLVEIYEGNTRLPGIYFSIVSLAAAAVAALYNKGKK